MTDYKFKTQARNYPETYNMKVRLLINFDSMSLPFKRIENQKFKKTLFPDNQ